MAKMKSRAGMPKPMAKYRTPRSVSIIIPLEGILHALVMLKVEMSMVLARRREFSTHVELRGVG